MRQIARLIEHYRQTQSEIWRRYYPLGKRRFIVRFGGFWGGTMLVVMTILERHRDNSQPLTDGLIILWLGFQLCLWGISGYIFGFLMWRRVERTFRSSKEA